MFDVLSRQLRQDARTIVVKEQPGIGLGDNGRHPFGCAPHRDMCRDHTGARVPEMERGVFGAASAENRNEIARNGAGTEQRPGQPLG